VHRPYCNHLDRTVAGESKKIRIETLKLECGVVGDVIFWVAGESKKIRIETSNLLEKGLIQKNRFEVSDIAEQK